MSYHSTVDELMSMAEGGDGDGIREQYYANWDDGDFVKLLDMLGEKIESYD
mgnify:CR=1 FL=1